MSLRAKLLAKDLALLLGLCALVAVALHYLMQQRTHVRAALNEYDVIQLVGSAQVRVAQQSRELTAAFLPSTPSAAAQSTTKPNFDARKSAEELQLAVNDLQRYKTLISLYASNLPPEISSQQKTDVQMRTERVVNDAVKLRDAIAALKAGAVSPQAARAPDASIIDDANALSQQLSELLELCDGFMNQTQLVSADDLESAITAAVVCAATILVLAVAVSFWQYRGIMSPLQSLRRWSRKIAEGDFSTEYRPSRDREFQELGRDVNKMAADLKEFCTSLQTMVAAKSKELVRSERLASVGYLAAGVAHEINNPLNTMSGYAELSLKRLNRSEEKKVIGEVLNALAIIRDEAFRCKDITSKLLSLAKGGQKREVVSLTAIAQDVINIVRGLRKFDQQRLVLSPTMPQLSVYANPAEIKQVLLNLVINALEALPDNGGQVMIEGRQLRNAVEIKVTDNGRGMSEQTLECVFEPFYTEKQGGESGSGLGLSICHAIITNSGGQIFAESDGLGLGSCFTIRLPISAPAGAPEGMQAAAPTTAATTAASTELSPMSSPVPSGMPSPRAR